MFAEDKNLGNCKKGGDMVAKILVPTDGSKPSKRSLQYAISFAKKMRASLILMSVIDKSLFLRQSVPVSSKNSKLVEPIEDYLKRGADAVLKDAERLCKKHNVQCKKIVKRGHPVEEIIKEAKRSKVDIIILGSHGKSAITATIVGSVTIGVLNRVRKVPVLVVR